MGYLLTSRNKFYTFKTISYVVDVYRGKIQPMDKLLDYAFYVSFFPTLLAGPITRATDFGPQIRKPLHISREMFAWGVFFIITGLFKKAVISDYISQTSLIVSLTILHSSLVVKFF